MSLISITLSTAYFTDFLGAKAALVPDEVIRDAESNIERYLVKHSQEFWDSLNGAIDKAIEENRETLIRAGAVADDDEEDL